MNIDWPLILVSFIFSCIGFVYFSFGKRTQSFRLMLSGLILMTYSYFVGSISMSLAIGILLTALPFMLKWW